jgi:hypothetical protein
LVFGGGAEVGEDEIHDLRQKYVTLLPAGSAPAG